MHPQLQTSQKLPNHRFFLYYRLLWLRIVSTSWTLPCFDPDELTGKLSSPHQMRKLVSISSKSTQERWIWQEGSTWEKSQRLCLDLQGKYFNFSKKFFTALLVACLVTSHNSQNFTRFCVLTSKLHKILVVLWERTSQRSFIFSIPLNISVDKEILSR